MKLVICLLAIMFFVLNTTDQIQTYYWLNNYGFHLEQNPFVTNNLRIAIKLVMGTTFSICMFALLILFDEAPKQVRQTMYYIIIILLIIGIISISNGVINNFKVMI